MAGESVRMTPKDFSACGNSHPRGQMMGTVIDSRDGLGRAVVPKHVCSFARRENSTAIRSTSPSRDTPIQLFGLPSRSDSACLNVLGGQILALDQTHASFTHSQWSLQSAHAPFPRLLVVAFEPHGAIPLSSTRFALVACMRRLALTTLITKVANEISFAICIVAAWLAQFE